MPLSFYMDVHIPRAITDGLRLRGIDVITAQEDGANELPDSELLNRASELKRALFTFDDDLLLVASIKLQQSIEFYEVFFAEAFDVNIGACIDELATFALAGEPEDMINQIIFIPSQL